MEQSNDNVGKDYLAGNNAWFYDFFKYQMGVKGRSFRDIITGNTDDRDALLGVQNRLDYEQSLYRNDVRSTKQDYSISTSMRLPSPIDITITPISLAWSRQYKVLPAISIIDTTTTFPDFKVEAQTNVLEKIKAVKKLVSKLGLRTGYGYKLSVHKTYENFATRSIREDKTRGNSFSPLINLDGILQWRPINFSYTWNYSSDTTVTLVDGAVSQHSGALTKKHDHVWTVKYTLPGKADRKFSLFKRWTVPIKGDLTMGATVGYNSSSAFRENLMYNGDIIITTTGKRDSVTIRSTGLRIAPELNYDFTDNIKGKLTYLYDRVFNGATKETAVKNEFILTVRINFN
jgi:hypothetical protein